MPVRSAEVRSKTPGRPPDHGTHMMRRTEAPGKTNVVILYLYINGGSVGGRRFYDILDVQYAINLKCAH